MLTHDTGLRRYLTDIATLPRLSAAEERRLPARCAQPDSGARNRLVEAHLGLVVAIAENYRGLGLDEADLVQEGNLGLLKAAEKYDPARRTSFGAYAAWWIRNAICAALSRLAHPVSLPERITRAAPAVRRARLAFEAEHGAATAAAIARAAGVSERLVEEVRLAYRPAAPFEEAPDRPSRDEAVPSAAAEALRACASLEPRRRRVVELRYGLDGQPPRTLRQVGEEIGVSRQRARDLEASAIAQLRRRVASETGPALATG